MNSEFTKIFKLLSTDTFKDPGTGMLFFPVYIYTYDPKLELEVKQEINELHEQLKRPNNHLQCFKIDIYDAFIDYLRESSFGKESFLDLAFGKEQEDPEEIGDYVSDLATSEEFITYLGKKINDFFKDDNPARIYILLYGLGTIFPYLRASLFLAMMEKYIKKYKMILFYPGSYKDGHYLLFNELDDEHVYRANNLNQLL